MPLKRYVIPFIMLRVALGFRPITPRVTSLPVHPQRLLAARAVAPGLGEQFLDADQNGDPLLRCLRSTFGLADFRSGQREIVETVAAGKDALILMPTGGGKSLCFQLPAVVLGGTTLVVSPLIALMKDQVMVEALYYDS